MLYLRSIRGGRPQRTYNSDVKALVIAIISIVFGRDIPVWACEHLISPDRILFEYRLCQRYVLSGCWRGGPTLPSLGTQSALTNHGWQGKKAHSYLYKSKHSWWKHCRITFKSPEISPEKHQYMSSVVNVRLVLLSECSLCLKKIWGYRAQLVRCKTGCREDLKPIKQENNQRKISIWWSTDVYNVCRCFGNDK